MANTVLNGSLYATHLQIICHILRILTFDYSIYIPIVYATDVPLSLA